MITGPVPETRCIRGSDGRPLHLETTLRGEALVDDAILNKGTAFTEEERDALGLRGLLPPRVSTMAEQAGRVLENHRRKESDLERYIHLIALLDRNATLFYRMLLGHLEEFLPIIYTPTVGQACERFGHIYRRPRGIYLTPEDTGGVDRILANWPASDIAVIVVTDGERILGLGDLGAGGMGISIGKSSLYVAGAGIHPARTLPVCLDTGTGNEALLEDPLYLGRPRRRVRGAAYDDLVEAFFAAAARRFPKAFIQFEDFGKNNAFRLLDRFRDRYCTFNDDIQGTGAVALAGVLSALRETGGRLEDQRAVILGAGSAGVGIGRALKGAGIWMLDSKGLLTADRGGLSPVQLPFARAEPGGMLIDVVRRVRPTILIGTSGQPGVFTREVIDAMAGPRPIVFPLSNPTSHSECTPEDVRAWTGGRALVAAGSPFPGTAQCNNLYIFPGVGLGIIAAGASRVTDGMFAAAARTLASLVPAGAIFPPLQDIRRLSAALAMAVAREAIAAGVAPPADDDTLRRRIADEIWEPEYLPFKAAASSGSPATRASTAAESPG